MGEHKWLTVGELIEALNNLPPDLPVGLYNDEGMGYKPLTTIEMCRGRWHQDDRSWDWIEIGDTVLYVGLS